MDARSDANSVRATEDGLALTVLAATLAIVAAAHAQCPPPPSATTETNKLLAADAIAGSSFGRAVSLSGDLALVGAPGDTVLNPNESQAYVYRLDGAQWTLEATLHPSGPTSSFDSQFGRAVCVNGDVAIIGAPWDGNGGAAYVFRYHSDTGAWQEQARLEPSNVTFNDYFGAAVAIDGDVALVGAPTVEIDPPGSVYVFRFDGSEWVQQAELVASDAESQDRFGNAVAVRGPVAVVGAFNEGNFGEPWGGTGAAYVFRFDAEAGAWQEEVKLVPDEPLPGQRDQFGRSVDINESADAVVVGTDTVWLAGSSPVPAGAAYVYRFLPDSCDGPECSPWVREAKLMSSDQETFDAFGRSVSIHGGLIVVGAPEEFDGACPFPQDCSRGAGYVYRFDPDVCTFGPQCNPWIEQVKLRSSDLQTLDLLGWSVSAGEGRALFGAWRNDDEGPDTGSAYVFNGLSDCNDNDALDLCETAHGDRPDLDGNGVPDACEGVGPGDLDGDGDVDVVDFDGFLGCVSGPGGAAVPPCGVFDFDHDGDVDLADARAFQLVFTGG